MPLTEAADASLVASVMDGDHAAFAELYDRYADRVFGLALKILGQEMAAEEVTQETFLKLWTRARTFRLERGAFSSWLLTIARRQALDRIRYHSYRPEYPASDSMEEGRWEGLVDPQSRSSEARWRAVGFALRALPPEQRHVIELAYYYGLTQREIAEQVEIPLGTVKTRVRLGMKKLRAAWLGEAAAEVERSK
jgi:RNA polymerase sigma-70 factor (ECF subfamily)